MVLRFLVRHAVRSLSVFLAVTLVTFLLVYSNATGIARGVLGFRATNEEVAAEVVNLGLDRPVFVQFAEWLAKILRGDLGASFFSSQPVVSMLAVRLPVTLSLVVISLVLTVVISVLVGVAAAVYGGWIDRVLQFLAVIGAAVPSFVVAIALVFAFAVAIRLFPATGYISFNADPGRWLASVALPVLAILVGSVGSAASQFRGSVMEALTSEYVRTLRTRGISERAIIFRHVLRNASGPGLTVLSLQTIGLLGGVIVIEEVFALPGVGVLAAAAAQQGDIPVIMGCVLATVVVVLIVNLVTDFATAFLIPRSRLS